MTKHADDYPEVLDAAQVAELLGLNIDYVRRLSRQGVLPAKRLPGGRTFRYFKDEVLDWLREQRVEPSASQPGGDRAQKPGGLDAADATGRNAADGDNA